MKIEKLTIGPKDIAAIAAAVCAVLWALAWIWMTLNRSAPAREPTENRDHVSSAQPERIAEP